MPTFTADFRTMIFHNYHTHTKYCDGKDEPERYVEQAISLGFGSLGFSGHAPVPFENNFAILPHDLPVYVNEIRALKKQYQSQIPIYISLEMDYIPGVSADFKVFTETFKLDYAIGSVHLVKREGRTGLWFIDGSSNNTYDKGLKELFDGDIRLGVESYYHQIEEMVIHQKPDIIGHFDKIKMHNRNRYFREDETWYKNIVSNTLQVVTENGSIIEVNTRGLYKKRTDSLFPSPAILSEILKLEIPITLNSDAHLANELNCEYKETHICLKQLGFKSIKVLKDSNWIDQPI